MDPSGFSVPMDKNVVRKEDEKVEKYQLLAQEIRKMHKVNTEIIPILIGTLGTAPKRQNFIEALPTMSHICLWVKLNPLGAGVS